MTAKIFCRSFKKVSLTTYVVMVIGDISKVNSYIGLSRVCSWSQ